MPRTPPNGRLARACSDVPTAPPTRNRNLHAIVSAARAGDDRAWTALVRQFEPRLRRIARSYRLAPADIDDALQATWLRLYKCLGRLDKPDAIGAWLTTTARRECLRILQAPVREFPSDDARLGDGIDNACPEAALLAAERRAILARALATLPDRPRRLMTVLGTQPELDYSEISAVLDMPTGSIGPIRARSLTRLARHAELRHLVTDPDA